MNYLGGPCVIAGFRRRGKQEWHSPRVRCDYGVRGQGEIRRCTAGFEGGGATHQGMQAASRSWKRPRDEFFPGASRRNAALPTT